MQPYDRSPARNQGITLSVLSLPSASQASLHFNLQHSLQGALVNANVIILTVYSLERPVCTDPARPLILCCYQTELDPLYFFCLRALPLMLSLLSDPFLSMPGKLLLNPELRSKVLKQSQSTQYITHYDYRYKQYIGFPAEALFRYHPFQENVLK